MKAFAMMRTFIKKLIVMLTALQLLTAPLFAQGFSQQGGNPQQQILGGLQQFQQQLISAEEQRSDLAFAQTISVVNQQRESGDLVFGCAILPTTSTKPDEALCKFDSSTPPQSLPVAENRMQEFAKIATGNAHQYELHLDEGANLDSPVGLRCLESKKDELDARLKSLEEQMDALLAGFKQQDDLFQKQYDEELDKLRDAKNILDGPSEQGLVDAKSIDYKSFFTSPACAAMITSKDIDETGGTTGGRGGLRGIFAKNRGLYENALDVTSYNFNKVLETKRNQIKTNFDRFGIEGLKSFSDATSGTDGTENPGSMKEAYDEIFKQSNEEIQVATNEAKIYASEFDFSIPSKLDSEFDNRLNKIASNADSSSINNWTDKLVNKCINGELGSSFFASNSLSTMSERVEQPNIRSKANTQAFSQFLSGLANASMTVAQKQSALEQFLAGNANSKYPLVIRDRAGGFITPQAYFNREVATCRAQIKTNKVFNDPTTGNNITYEQARLNAKRSIQKLQRTYGNFVAKAQNAITAKFISCEGIDYDGKAGSDSNSCNANTLTPSSSQFCMRNSASCANNVKSCQEQLDRTIKQTEQQMQNTAVAISTLENRKRAQLTERLRSLANLAQQTNAQLRQQYKFLEPLSLNLNELVIDQIKDTLNPEVILAAGGNLSAVLEEFQTKVETNIKGALAAQRLEITEKINKEKNIRKARYANQQGYWEGVASQCLAVAEQYDNAITKFNSAEETRANTEGTALNNLCRNATVANTRNCSQESINKVEESMGQLATYLSPQDGAAYREFLARCEIINQQAEQSENVAESNVDEAISHCSNDDPIKSFALSMNTSQLNNEDLKTLLGKIQSDSSELTDTVKAAQIATEARRIARESANFPRDKQYADYIALLADKGSYIVDQCLNAKSYSLKSKKCEKNEKDDTETCPEKPGVPSVVDAMNGRNRINAGIAATGFGEINVPACAGVNQQNATPFDLIQDAYNGRAPAAIGGGGFSTR